MESFIHRYSMEGSFCSDSYGLGITIASPPRSPAQKAQTFPTKLIIPSSPSPGPTSATRRISLHHPGIIFSPHEACIILDFENVTGMDYSFTTCLQDLETQCDTQKIKLCLYGK